MLIAMADRKNPNGKRDNLERPPVISKIEHNSAEKYSFFTGSSERIAVEKMVNNIK